MGGITACISKMSPSIVQDLNANLEENDVDLLQYDVLGEIRPHS